MFFYLFHALQSVTQYTKTVKYRPFCLKQVIFKSLFGSKFYIFYIEDFKNSGILELLFVCFQDLSSSHHRANDIEK